MKDRNLFTKRMVQQTSNVRLQHRLEYTERTWSADHR